PRIASAVSLPVAASSTFIGIWMEMRAVSS
ncbi:hypothetical protein A2U01_0118322, partial [Trifolium medium]|nr:hypothetical protein [Trifolium medium]